MHPTDILLEHHLRLKFGLGFHEPNQYQLSLIKRDIKLLYNVRGQSINMVDLHLIVRKYCQSSEVHLTGGVDNSDINTLLMLAIKNNYE